MKEVCKGSFGCVQFLPFTMTLQSNSGIRCDFAVNFT